MRDSAVIQPLRVGEACRLDHQRIAVIPAGGEPHEGGGIIVRQLAPVQVNAPLHVALLEENVHHFVGTLHDLEQGVGGHGPRNAVRQTINRRVQFIQSTGRQSNASAVLIVDGLGRRLQRRSGLAEILSVVRPRPDSGEVRACLGPQQGPSGKQRHRRQHQPQGVNGHLTDPFSRQGRQPPSCPASHQRGFGTVLSEVWNQGSCSLG